MNDLVIFIHIPKTAGTTFNYIVKKNYNWFYKLRKLDLNEIRNYLTDKENVAINLPGGYGDATKALELIQELHASELNRIGYIGGHIGYIGRKFNDRSIRYLSFIRPPLERLMSDFREHCKPGRLFYKELRKSEFDLNAYLNIIKENRLDNIMTRHYIGPYNFFESQKSELNETHLKKALQNVSEMLIGEVDDFDKSVYCVSKELSWHKLKYKKLNASTFNNFDKGDHSEKIGELIKYDLQLYDSLKKNTLKNLNVLDKILMPLKFLL